MIIMINYNKPFTKGLRVELRLNVIDMAHPLPFEIKVYRDRYQAARWSNDRGTYLYDNGFINDLFRVG